MKKLYHSLKILIEPTKSTELYLNLFLNGYINLWSANICLKRASRK